MIWLSKEDECLGKYRHRKDAEALAEQETARTGEGHHVCVSQYYCPYESTFKIFWSIFKTRKPGV